MTGRAVLGRVDVVEVLNLDALLRELGFSLVTGFAFEAKPIAGYYWTFAAVAMHIVSGFDGVAALRTRLARRGWDVTFCHLTPR